MQLINRTMLSVGLFFLTQLPVLAGDGCDMGMSGGSTGRVSLLLLALAVGYGVLVLSQSQTKPLNTLGRIIGGIILVVGFVGLLCSAIYGAKRMCGRSSSCNLGQKPACPMMGHGGDSTTAPAPVAGNQ